MCYSDFGESRDKWRIVFYRYPIKSGFKRRSRNAFIQGGYKYVDKRTDVYVPFPIAYSTVLSIVGTPVVNAENSSGRGLENIKTYNTTSFVYYSGFDINYKNLLWLSVGI